MTRLGLAVRSERETMQDNKKDESKKEKKNRQRKDGYWRGSCGRLRFGVSQPK